MLTEAVRQHGEREMVVLGERRLTYAEVADRSAWLARGLLGQGVGKGSRVALLAPNGPEWITAWLAASRIGAVVILLNTYNKARELGWVLHHCDAQTLLAVDQHLDHDYRPRLEAAVPGLAGQPPDRITVVSHPFLRSVWMWSDDCPSWARPVGELASGEHLVGPELLAAAEGEVSPADPMVVVYSSGSTADPKGAIHSHGAVVRHAHNLGQFRDLEAGHRLYTPMPLFWIGGLSYTLVAAIHAGATLVFEDRFEPGETLALIERERITHVMGWPHMSKALIEHPDFDQRDLSSVIGGSLNDLLPEDRQPTDPTLRANSLGMTETLGPHTLEVIGSELPEGKRGSFGRSAPGLQHRIVDPVTGEDCAPGQLGEIWVRGYSVMLGLHRRERDDVFTPDGWYRTGDGGYLDDDGHLYFKGRTGDVIKASGTLVTPREVELAIESLPEVMHAFVMGVAHPDRVEDVAAAVVLRPGATLEPEQIRLRIKEDLSSYKVPRHVAVYHDQQDLPWLDSGKIDGRGVQRLLDEAFAAPS
ncbi:MAG: class I adenylate-forming enzyme family protein [Acidimicrobiales bacterium]